MAMRDGQLVCDPIIADAVGAMGRGALTEAGLVEHVHPLFSRALARNVSADEIYLANHSLGRPLDCVRDEVVASLDAWYEDMDGAWGLWMMQRERYRAELARLLGVDRADSVVPKVSAAQGLRSVIHALPAERPVVVATRAEFDSIDFVLKAMAHKGRIEVRWVEAGEDGLIDEGAVARAIDGDVDLVVCSVVCFAMGQMLTRIGDVIDAAHASGAKVLLDAYHAAGVIELGDEHRHADFMIGGNYKYTRGGAGACWLWVNPRHLRDGAWVPDPDALFTTETGWFAKAEPFAYRRTGEPEFAGGGDGWLEATEPVLTYAQALPGLVLTNAIGVDRLRAYSLGQMGVLSELLKAKGVEVSTPEHHGAYVLVRVEDARGAVAALKSHGVNADARPCPSGHGAVVRLCPDLLNTRTELEDASERAAQALV